MTEAIKLHIHVGANIPGYLPEGDVFCTDDLSSAIESLRHELKDQQDYYYEGCVGSGRCPGHETTRGAIGYTYRCDGSCLGQDCECAWCDVATDVEAALSAITDGDTAYVLTNQCAAAAIALAADGRAHMPSLGWIFSPPEGADIHHWVTMVPGDRDSCEIAQEQDD